MNRGLQPGYVEEKFVRVTARLLHRHAWTMEKSQARKHANMRRSQYADNCMYNSSQLDILLRLNPNSWTMETTQRTELYDIVVIPSHVLDNIASLTVPTTYYDLHV